VNNNVDTQPVTIGLLTVVFWLHRDVTLLDADVSDCCCNYMALMRSMLPQLVTGHNPWFRTPCHGVLNQRVMSWGLRPEI